MFISVLYLMVWVGVQSSGTIDRRGQRGYRDPLFPVNANSGRLRDRNGAGDSSLMLGVRGVRGLGLSRLGLGGLGVGDRLLMNNGRITRSGKGLKIQFRNINRKHDAVDMGRQRKDDVHFETPGYTADRGVGGATLGNRPGTNGVDDVTGRPISLLSSVIRQRIMQVSSALAGLATARGLRVGRDQMSRGRMNRGQLSNENTTPQFGNYRSRIQKRQMTMWYQKKPG